MIQTDPRTNLLDLDREGLRGFFAGLGEKPFRGDQVMKWIYHRGAADFEQMTDLGKALRAKLNDSARITPPSVTTEQISTDGTRKWLIGVHGGAVETVYIPEPTRGTLCVSSQIGCMLNCTFCSTATQGFQRNLTTAEIIGQVWLAAQALGHDAKTNRRLTNIVLMGMGEPLLNFDAVVTAMALMRDDLGFGLANKRVTLSTAGLVPAIDRLSEASDVSLAVSLHSPVNEIRDVLVPLNRKYPIAELMAACERYLRNRPRANVTFEYTLLKGVNDDLALADKLVKLLRRLPSKLNLIPFNPFPGTRYECSDETQIRAFQERIMSQGVIATVRRTRGQDIDAACGQLVGQVADRTRRQRTHQAELAASEMTAEVAA
jgi:23S rRNA (adenine2503-C2)-methyltransferase